MVAERKIREELMKVSYFTKAVSIFAVVAMCALAPAPSARAQNAVDPDAQSVLAAMSNYLGGLRSFSVEYVAADEIITPEGQKLQFLHSGEFVVQRPDKLYALRRGAAGAAEIFLNDRRLTLFGRQANGFLEFPASSIDAAIDVVRNLGFDAPGADLLAQKPFDSSTTDMNSGDHIGMTFIDGVEVHQLAFRGVDVDWQLWVTTGDKPLPVRYVITSKSVTGAPQYTLQLRNWDSAAQIGAARFAFTPPQGVRQLDPTSVTVNAIGDLAIK
jgi:hypothetical protein